MPALERHRRPALLGRHRRPGDPSLRPGARTSTSSGQCRDGRARSRSPPARDGSSWRIEGMARVLRLGSRERGARLDRASSRRDSAIGSTTVAAIRPVGSGWVSMFDPAAAGQFTGLLHRVDPDGVGDTVRSVIGVANGLAFSPDGRTMYFADYAPGDGLGVRLRRRYRAMPGNERVFLDFGDRARSARRRLRRRGRLLLDRLRLADGP